MPWFEIVEYVMTSGIIAMHIIALALLKKSKVNNRSKIQIIIIAALCECQLMGALLSTIFYIIRFRVFTIVPGTIICFMVIFISFTYYFLMTLLTVDRHLIFYFNLKYQLYVTRRNLLKLIIVFVAVFLMITVIFSVLISLEKISLENLELGLAVLFIIIYIAYIFLIAVTYGYIFLVYRRQLGLRKNTQKAGGKDHFNLLVPSLIIMTFILFSIVPDLFKTTTVFGIIPANGFLSHLVSHFFRIKFYVLQNWLVG